MRRHIYIHYTYRHARDCLQNMYDIYGLDHTPNPPHKKNKQTSRPGNPYRFVCGVMICWALSWGKRTPGRIRCSHQKYKKWNAHALNVQIKKNRYRFVCGVMLCWASSWGKKTPGRIRCPHQRQKNSVHAAYEQIKQITCQCIVRTKKIQCTFFCKSVHKHMEKKSQVHALYVQTWWGLPGIVYRKKGVCENKVCVWLEYMAVLVLIDRSNLSRKMGLFVCKNLPGFVVEGKVRLVE